MESLPAVLIVDNDKVVLDTMQEQLSGENYRVAAVSKVAEALQKLRVERFGVIIADQFLPETPGIEFLRTCREIQPLSSRMIVTGMAFVPGIEEAISRGDAFRVLRKPWTRYDLTVAVTQATDRYRLVEQLESATRETRRQRSDLAALGRQLEVYRQQLLAITAQPGSGLLPVESEELFRQIICHLDQAISVIDPESKRLLYLSPLHERIWGRPLKELYENDSSWIEAIHPEDRERVLKAASDKGIEGTYDEQYRVLRPDGEVRWIRDRALAIRDAEQKPYRIAGIAEDITDRKRASDQLEMKVRERTEELAWANLALESEITERRRAGVQLQETDQRLQKALEELHAMQQQVIQLESLRALGKMAGGVAQDFNNALIPILGYAELLIERPELLDDRIFALKYLQLMRTAARDATAVAGRLLEFYRQRDETEFFEPVDLLEALREAISMTRPKWHDEALTQGVRITVEQEFQPLPMIACHRGEIREMVTNLLLNAADALPQGGRIVLKAYSHEQNAVFEVQDDGIGMTEEVRARCMEPFVTTKGERGTGMGLAIVYRIVQRHHGKLEIESKLGEGTIVRVRLPFFQGLNAAEPAEGALVTRKLSILLVDDEKVVCDVIALFLRHAEHQVEVAASGLEALRLVREKKFDLVITNHAMPGVNGGNFATALRSGGFDVPILMLTGFGEMMTTSDSIPAGATRLVSQPLTMEDLHSAIAAIFQDLKAT